MGFAYSLLFPARLRVVATDTTLFFTTPEEAWHWLESPNNGATRLVRSEPTKEDNIRQNRRGQHRMKARMDRDLPAVPNCEQRIQERYSALQQAAALSSVERYSSLDVPVYLSSDVESSFVTWPFVQSSHVPPDITPETSDNII
ncbi:hypothetical protein NDU88_006690 [Pleurodeles waltl]|uniref:Uncharacterized protein n=1 Tax=Pleurodeles waltl TaxID=8319 RepID=A0AAV7RQV0_PLEWA|nr:hypothetical protein NDU88_006690 [Pleurodeles waltl]